VLAGDVSLGAAEGADASSAGAGDVFGVINTMAGRQLGLSATVRKAGVALRIERDDLFALLGERPELLRQMFSGLFSAETAPSLATV
jgi:CRP-like cAMP-binding protein